MQRIILKHALAIFFISTFLLSWTLWLASGVFNKPSPTETRDYSWLIAQFGVFMPSVMALLISSFTDSRQRGISWTILLLIFLPVSLLGEEIGWRGFALPRLMEKFSPLQASFILGVVWALWHLPIDIRYGFGLTGAGAVFVRLLWTWPVTIIFTWFYLRSKRCLLAPFMLHTSANVLPDLGFSNYEQAIGVMFLLNAVFATAIGFRLAKNPETKFKSEHVMKDDETRS